MFSESSDLQALEKTQVWRLFNSQTNSCGMLQLLVTIPSPAGDFDFGFRHVKLGGWLGLEQLGGWVGTSWGKDLCSVTFGRGNLKESDSEVLLVLPGLFRLLWQTSCL